MNNVNHFDTPAELMAGLAKQVESDLLAVLATKGTATLAIPGGTTPAPFFEILSNADLDWANVSIVLTDERFVPADHQRSNSSLVKTHLLQNKAAVAKMIPFYAVADEPEDVLEEISEGISGILPLDVCIVGMGADMHTASLFPDSEELSEALVTEAPVHPVRPISQPEARLTLSGKVLTGSQKSYVLIKGQEKMDALEKAWNTESVLEAPIKVILNSKHCEIFYAE